MARIASGRIGWLIVLALVGAGGARGAHAQTVIASQDFNALSAANTVTTNTLSSGQALTNLSSFNTGGPGLDFTSLWFATRSGMPTGPRQPTNDTSDFVGVNSFNGNGLPTTSPSGAVVGVSGDHNFEFNDTDGRVDVVFEPVDVSGEIDRELRMYFWVVNDTFEAQDRFMVTLSDGLSTHVAADYDAAELMANRGLWVVVSVDLDDLVDNLGFDEVLTLVVSSDTDAGGENIVFDSVEFLADSEGGGGAIERTIPEIQGPGVSSPHIAELVETTGIVVGDFQAANQLGGFFMGDEVGDGDDLTSDGIFVAAPPAMNVEVGDLVTVIGSVGEPGGLTTIVAQSVTVVGPSGGIAPTFVEMPETTNGELERFEGMLVSFDEMSVDQTFFLGRYGQMTLSSADDGGVIGRMIQPTQLYDANSPSAIALADENQRRLLVLDDGQDVNPLGDNPNPVPYIGAPPPDVIRSGDRIQDLVGVLDQGAINSGGTTDYRVHPVEAPTFIPHNPRLVAPASNGLTVVSLNVLNYFTTLGSRGARNSAELIRQRNKLVATIKELDADVYGLIEIENNAAAMTDLLAALNATTPGTYLAVGPSVVGTDEIKVAFIYTPATIEPTGAYAVLDDSVDPRAMTTRNRPALAQSFTFAAETFTVVVNHWKSKGSACNTISPGTNEIVDPDLGDGQGNCNLSRVRMAEAMVDWLAGDPTMQGGDPDVLIIGDLNAYANEDPSQVLKDNGYVDLVDLRIGPNAYSYVFDGQSGYLDHAFASPSLAEKIEYVAEWHSNADEPQVLDYDTEFNPPGYYAPNAYRASDHDPLIVGIAASPDAIAVPVLDRSASSALALVLLVLGAAYMHGKR